MPSGLRTGLTPPAALPFTGRPAAVLVAGALLLLLVVVAALVVAVVRNDPTREATGAAGLVVAAGLGLDSEFTRIAGAFDDGDGVLPELGNDLRIGFGPVAVLVAPS